MLAGTEHVCLHRHPMLTIRTLRISKSVQGVRACGWAWAVSPAYRPAVWMWAFRAGHTPSMLTGSPESGVTQDEEVDCDLSTLNVYKTGCGNLHIYTVFNFCSWQVMHPGHWALKIIVWDHSPWLLCPDWSPQGLSWCPLRCPLARWWPLLVG